MCEFLYRDGGTTVYVCSNHTNGLTVDQYRKLVAIHPATDADLKHLKDLTGMSHS